MRAVRSRLAVLVVSLLAILPTRSALAEDHWLEVRSPHFRVMTNGSAADGRRVVDEFEQMRYVLHWRFPSLRMEASAPLLIVAVKNEETAFRLEPELARKGAPRVAGNFIESWARNCAMIRLDEWSRGAREVVYHEYTHSILHLNSHWLPRWLDEGMAEFFAYTRFADHKIYIGVETGRERALNGGHLLSLAEMLDERPKDYLKDERETQLFYAEAWAMVHFLTFGKGMDGGKKLAGFFDDLQKGREQKAAFADRFGPTQPLQYEFQDYLRKFTLTAGILPAPPPLDEAGFTERTLLPAEVAYELGTFHVTERDTSGGRALIEQALALDPKLAGAHEEMGYLHYSKGEDDDARAEWKQAAALDPTLYRARFAYLMTGPSLASQGPEQQQSTLTELRAIAHLNPNFAPAFVEIALLHWQRGDLDAAFTAAREATRLEPWRAGYRMLAGHILLAQGKGADAAHIARTTAEFAEGTDRAEAVSLWLEVPPAERGDGPPLTYDLAPGVTVAHATITGLVCSNRDTGAKFTVDVTPHDAPAAPQLHLSRAERIGLGSADTLYRGERRMSVCEHAAGRNALIAYKPTAAGAGDLLWLHVLDDLPSIRAAHIAAATPAPSTAVAAAP